MIKADSYSRGGRTGGRGELLCIHVQNDSARCVPKFRVIKPRKHVRQENDGYGESCVGSLCRLLCRINYYVEIFIGWLSLPFILSLSMAITTYYR